MYNLYTNITIQNDQEAKKDLNKKPKAKDLKHDMFGATTAAAAAAAVAADQQPQQEGGVKYSSFRKVNATTTPATYDA
jgi:hypothetical protein